MPDQKLALQHNGFQYLESLLQGYSPQRAKEITGLWLEHEEGQTPEARLVLEMDQFEAEVTGTKKFERVPGTIEQYSVSSSEAMGKFSPTRERKSLRKTAAKLPIVFTTGIHLKVILLSGPQLKDSR